MNRCNITHKQVLLYAIECYVMDNRHYSFNIFVFITSVTIATSGSVAEKPHDGLFKKVQCLTTTCTIIRTYYAKNRMSCLTGCVQSATCYGVQWNVSQQCVELYLNCFTSSAVAPCSGTAAVNISTLYKRTFTKCQNNGTWVSVSAGCQCVGCWVGYYCERYPRNCSELATYNYPLKSLKCVLDLYGDARALCTTMCSRASSTLIFTGLGWINNDTLHNRTWADYEGGYFLDKHDFFVGLACILAQNRLGLTTIRAQVDFLHPVKNVSWTMFQENFNFNVGNASSGYSFSADSASTYYTDYVKNTIKKTYALDDVISLSAGVPFSTYDRDNDKIQSENCGALAGAGWWFKNCSYTVNPFGTFSARRIPGVNMSDPEVVSSYEGFVFYFTNDV